MCVVFYCIFYPIEAYTLLDNIYKITDSTTLHTPNNRAQHDINYLLARHNMLNMVACLCILFFCDTGNTTSAVALTVVITYSYLVLSPFCGILP